MTMILELDPEIERKLGARADARGISLSSFLQELLAKEADSLMNSDPVPVEKRFANLSDLLLNSPFAGSNLELERATPWFSHQLK